MPFEVALVVDPVPLDRGIREPRLRCEDGADLVGRPHVELSFDTFGVRVLGGVEAAVRMPQIAQDVADRLVQHLPVDRRRCDLRGVQVDPREQRLVIEHLLEVRHEPDAVDGIAREAAAEVVVHPARRHGAERGLDRGEGGGRVIALMRAQQQLEAHRLRELRWTAEPAPLVVMLLAQLLVRGRQRLGTRKVSRGIRRGHSTLPDRARQLFGVSEQVVTTGAPRVVDRAAQVGERRQTVPGLIGEVRAAVEGPAVGRAEHRHRPAALPRHGLCRGHVDRVDVRTFLSVDLHVDEQFVHHRRGRGILERLVRHDVAPVTRRVADRQEHRLVLGPSPRERVVTPLVPVDGVVAVLAQVWAGRVGQPVHPADATGAQL